MLEIFLLVTAFLGSSISAIIDLKTTEIPDEIPYVMIGIGIIGYSIKSYLVWSYWPILLSFIVGLGFLGFGFFMYYTGQWGGGDAKLLSAIGFLLPTLSSYSKTFFPFSLSFFFNVFLVGSLYMILYALVLSFQNKKIWSVFFHDLKVNSKMLLLLNIGIVIFLFVLGVFMVGKYAFLTFGDVIRSEIIIVSVTIGLFLVWRFAKTVEEVGFRKRIPVSKLREGDVLLDYKVWEGVTKKEVKRIRKSGKKYIWIKEGVRFGPAFPLALVFTLVVGDGIIWLIGLF